ncbi:MAG: 3-deoxy-8-phosphooctulonate synthase [Candidatus Melainabacteria bacterium]|nr:3-deoxy-8-phosphooctulonate synthase [Candidatus Melainabacteria bacterium]
MSPSLQPLVIIAGPCVIEHDGAVNLQMARALQTICQQLSTPEQPIELYFKSSYDKANRTSVGSYRGPGLEAGLEILRRIQGETGVRLLSDVHTPQEAEAVGPFLDMLQIPAFLCRQTDLLTAAGETGKPVNVKKGQFLAPTDVIYCADKIRSTGNPNIYITERGTTFGYNNLVVDMRAIPIVQSYGIPLIFDATHSVQLPGAQGGVSGGQREYAPVLARAAIAAGCSGLFFETHPNPKEGLSDAANMLPIGWVEPMLETCLLIRKALQVSRLPLLNEAPPQSKEPLSV